MMQRVVPSQKRSYPSEESDANVQIMRDGEGVPPFKSKKAKIAKNVFATLKDMQFSLFWDPTSESRDWMEEPIESVKDLEYEFRSILSDEMKKSESLGLSQFSGPEYDCYGLMKRMKKSKNFGLHFKCRIGCFIHDFSLNLRPFFRFRYHLPHRPNQAPERSQFVDEMEWYGKLSCWMNHYEDFLINKCFRLEKAYELFERNLEERVVATERLQDCHIEKPLNCYLKNWNVVDIALGYICLELANCYVAK